MVLIDLPFSPWTHVTFKHPSRMGRLVLNLIVTSSQLTVFPSSPATQSGDNCFCSDMRCAFWLMHGISVPSELKIGEMVCNGCLQALMVTSSSSILLLFEESVYAAYLVSSGKY